MTHDSSDPTELVRVRSDAEAAVVINALAEHGLRAAATGGFTSGFQAEAPGDVTVVVRQADLDRARHVLADIQREWADADASDE